MHIFGVLLLFVSLLIGKTYTNELINSQSPYLLAHAHNPVKWMPYSKKIFELAKKEKKLIFLSIGYSTCHWCHVMEKESFENAQIAKILNANYISVKVDKEEMPQIDLFYQHIHTLLHHGRNGWPLSIFLTPDKKILYSARYIPAKDAYGVEGLKTLLPKLSKMYNHHTKDFMKLINTNQQAITKKQIYTTSIEDKNITNKYVKKMQKRYDNIYKGFDRRPRFPLSSNLSLLLDIYLLNGDKRAFKMVDETLRAMAMGGIYDQIEGGFFRYSTDQDWVVPHFEKMLYTNAQLIQLYTKAYLLTSKKLYKKVVQETIREYERHFEKDGLYFGASDADTKGEEGGYFTYDLKEVTHNLKKANFTPKEIEENLDYIDISEIGNFKDDQSNVQFNTGYDKKPKRLHEVLSILKKIRQKRTFPYVDQKILTSWNAMMISALLEASCIDDKYGKKGLFSLERLLQKNYKNGILYHQSISDKKLIQEGLLEDYAFLIDALLKAYSYSYDKKYLHLAHDFMTKALQKFYIKSRWYVNSKKPLVLNQYNDKYYPTPLSVMFDNLLTISNLTYDLKLWHQTKKMISDEKNKILLAFDKAPKALRLLIRLEEGTILLKSSKQNLLQNKEKIRQIKYPFLLTKPENTNSYLLCNMESCFYYDKNLTKVIENIK